MNEQNSQDQAVDLREILNPKSKVSSPATFGHLLWLRRWIVLSAWLILGVPAAVFLAFFEIPRVYWVNANLRFPNVVGSEHNMVRDVSITELASIKSLFESYKVMSKTVQSMQLQFRIRTKNVFRKAVFDRIQYGEKTPLGQYEFAFESPRELAVMFKPFGGKEWQTVFSGNIPADNTVTFSGITAVFTQTFLQSGSAKFEASMLPLQTVYEDMRQRLGVKSLDQESYVKVNYAIFFEDRDPFIVADILNALVENFISVYSGTTEVQDINVLTQMERNLEIAKEKEKAAQDALAKLYARYPGLMEVRQSDPYALVNAQTEKSRLVERIEDLAQLVNRRGAGSGSQGALWSQDALNLLNAFGVVQAMTLQNRIRDLEARRVELLRDYSPTHAKVQAVDSTLAGIVPEVEGLVQSTQASFKTRLDRVNADIMRNLPNSLPAAVNLEATRLNAEKENTSQVVHNLQLAYDRAKLSMGRDFFKVNVVDSARPPVYHPPSLKRRLLFAFGALTALFFPGALIIIALQLIFPRVWTRDDASRKLGANVLGTIFYVRSKSRAGDKKRNEVEDRLLHKGEASTLLQIENFRTVRAEVENYFQIANPGGKLGLMVTSTQPFEGKSLFAANLAVSLSRKNRRTLLVDADFRHGRQEVIFEKSVELGATDVMSEPGLTEEMRRNLLYGTIVNTHEENLFFLPRGRNLKGAEAITLTKIQGIFSLVQGDFDVVIVDTPPIMAAADALNLMSVITNVIFVVRSGVPASEAESAIELINRRGVKLGCVVNAVRESPFLKNHFNKYKDYYGT